MFQIVQLTPTRKCVCVLIGMTFALAVTRLAAWAKETETDSYLLNYDPQRPKFFDTTLAAARATGEILKN